MLHIWHFILFEQMDSFEKPKKSPKCNKVLASFCAGFTFIVLVILVIFVVKYFPNDEPNLYKIVQTKDGGIRGRRFETAYRKRPYFAFRGIRYGKPPVGDLRFKVCTFLGTPYIVIWQNRCSEFICYLDFRLPNQWTHGHQEPLMPLTLVLHVCDRMEPI